MAFVSWQNVYEQGDGSSMLLDDSFGGRVFLMELGEAEISISLRSVKYFDSKRFFTLN